MPPFKEVVLPNFALASAVVMMAILLMERLTQKVVLPVITLLKKQNDPATALVSRAVQTEVGVAFTAYHANLVAPALNSMLQISREMSETMAIQTEILKSMQHEQARHSDTQDAMAKTLAILVDRIPRK